MKLSLAHLVEKSELKERIEERETRSEKHKERNVKRETKTCPSLAFLVVLVVLSFLSFLAFPSIRSAHGVRFPTPTHVALSSSLQPTMTCQVVSSERARWDSREQAASGVVRIPLFHSTLDQFLVEGMFGLGLADARKECTQEGGPRLQ